MKSRDLHRWAFLRSMLTLKVGGVPYNDIHKKTGLAKTTLIAILKGDSEPSQKTLRSIAFYLKTTNWRLLQIAEDYITGI